MSVFFSRCIAERETLGLLVQRLQHLSSTPTSIERCKQTFNDIFCYQVERARNDLERELEDLQDALDEQGGATQAQVR